MKLLILGSGKSGKTSLANFLCKSPQIKLVQFEMNHIQKKYQEKLFQEKISMTTIGIIKPKDIKFINKLNNCKIIHVIRNPYQTYAAIKRRQYILSPYYTAKNWKNTINRIKKIKHTIFTIKYEEFNEKLPELILFLEILTIQGQIPKYTEKEPNSTEKSLIKLGAKQLIETYGYGITTKRKINFYEKVIEFVKDKLGKTLFSKIWVRNLRRRLS